MSRCRSLIKSPMICCLIWLLFYEGSISNPFQVWRNTVAGTAVVLVLADIKNRVVEIVVVHFRTNVCFQRSAKNKHSKPSDPFELVVASCF